MHKDKAKEMHSQAAQWKTLSNIAGLKREHFSVSALDAYWKLLKNEQYIQVKKKKIQMFAGSNLEQRVF